MRKAMESVREFAARILPVRNVRECLKNLRKNWYFPITLFFFLLLEARMSVGYVIGMLMTTILAVIVATQVKNIGLAWKQEPLAWRIFHIISAAGICWFAETFFYIRWNESTKLASLKDRLPGNLDIGLIVSIGLACVGACFAAWALAAFWRWLRRELQGTPVTQLTKKEIIAYALLFLILSSFVAFAFLHSSAFYGNDLSHGDIGYVDNGVIFSGDPFGTMRELSYLKLIGARNDYRQPLFAVFAMPFIGAAYFFAKIFFLPKPLFMFLLNLPQIALLFSIVLLLAKSMGLSPVKHICFLGVAFVSFPFLLFSCVMEQYIVSVFWLVLAVYLYAVKGRTHRLAVCAAGGTLLPSFFFAPLTSDASLLREGRRWWRDLIKTGLLFLSMVVLIRLDVICDLLSDPKILFDYTSVGTADALSFSDKFMQYCTFACSCFAAPAAGARTGYEEGGEVPMWLQNPVTQLSIAGLIILGLAILSAVLNRKRKICCLSAMWLAVSFFILCIMGYGTNGNELLLYTLYFGWPLLILLYSLVERIGGALRVRWLAPACAAVSAVILAWHNIPAMLDMLRFAIKYYPA